jgi:nucleotide-binding universal stress UspA family protein
MYDRILVATDGSDGAAAATEHAVDIAATYGGTIHALYVIDVRMSPISTGMDRDEVLAMYEASDDDPPAGVLDRAAARDVPAVEAVRVGVPHEAICEYVDENAVDLVVMGTRGETGLEHALVGSTTERVVRTADVPVLAVHEDESA